MVQDGGFRNDLYYRLAVLELFLPPLRDRGEDIVELANYYIVVNNSKFGKNINLLDKSSIEILSSYSWPGNVRELRNFIEKSMVLCQENNLNLKQLPSAKDTANNIAPKKYKDFNSHSILFLTICIYLLN
ncbi:MAG: hypothetical protein ACOZCL_07480 [Bacillota bacterium]